MRGFVPHSASSSLIVIVPLFYTTVFPTSSSSNSKRLACDSHATATASSSDIRRNRPIKGDLLRRTLDSRTPPPYYSDIHAHYNSPPDSQIHPLTRTLRNPYWSLQERIAIRERIKIEKRLQPRKVYWR